MVELSSGFEIEKELTRIFNRFNHHFWSDELPEVIITFKPKKGSLGHISSDPVWVSSNNGFKDKYELNISAYHINRDPIAICETILHEQCHLYCSIHGIQECSNHGRYHNKKFKTVAENHGLNVKKSSSYFGYSITTLDKDAQAYVAKLNIKQTSYKFVQPRRQEKLLRYQCPRCKVTTAWVSSEQDLLCGICKISLEYTPATPRRP